MGATIVLASWSEMKEEKVKGGDVPGFYYLASCEVFLAKKIIEKQ